MEEFKKTGLMDGGGSEPDWITVENHEHVLVEPGQSKKDAIKKHFKKSGVLTYATSLEYKKRELTNRAKSDTIKYNKSSPKEFVKTLIEAKESNLSEDSWRVDTKGENDYIDSKLFTTGYGSCVAVTPEGDIVSVCKKEGSDDRGSDLLKKAIAEGGDRLDAFGEKLYGFYTRNGFEPVSWTPFDEKYKPDGWLPEYGKEKVVFYKYTGKQTQESYNDFLNKVPSNKSYDEAKQIRDRRIKK